LIEWLAMLGLRTPAPAADLEADADPAIEAGPPIHGLDHPRLSRSRDG
jgi:hypothetical protein